MRGKTVTPRKPKSRPHTWPPPSPSPLFCVLSVDEGTSGKDARRTDPTEAPLSPDPQAQVGCTVRTKDALTHCAPPEERLTHTAGASHRRESPSHRDSVSQGHSVTFLSVCLFFPSSFFFFFCRMGCREETLELQQPATLLPTFDFQCLILRGRVLSLWSLRSLFTFTTEHKHTNWLVVSCHCHQFSLSVPVCRWGSVTTLSLSVGRKLRFDFLKGELSQSHRQTERQAGSCGSCERKPLVDCGLLVNCLCVSSLMGLIPCAVVDIEQLSASCVMPVNALTINPTNSGN